jgi:hypothetical protein
MMSWFTPAPGLSDKARGLLKDMANSGESETSGVAEILNTIASNGEGQEKDEHLLTCAEEIRDAVQAFIVQMGGDGR